jgi:hypothetical protein
VADGQIITFYSYKGGTGRTMSVANTACLLARRLANERVKTDGPAGIQVVAIDWDFEAPGLHRYFIPYIPMETRKESEQKPGCIDLLAEVYRRRADFGKDSFSNRSIAKALLKSIKFERYLVETTIPGLAIVKAGRFDSKYAREVNAFKWEKFFYSTEGFFPGFADFLREEFSYILVDSRTGVTDTSGICTALLPDKLVVPFTPNSQSLSGLEEVVRRAVTYRRNSEDWRPLSVFPLPSRVDVSRPVLAEEWRNRTHGDKAAAATELDPDILGYEQVFARLFSKLYGPESSSLGKYFDEVVLQHVPDYAYGEPIAVELEATDSRIFLRRSYENFVDRLIELSGPWESLEDSRRNRELVTLIKEARARVEAAVDPKDQDAVEEAIRLGFRLVEGQPSVVNAEDLVSAVLAIAAFAIKANPSAASLLVTSALKQAERFGEEDWQIYEAALREACMLFDKAAIVSEAEQYRTRHLQLLRDRVGPENPATLSAMQQLASTLRSAGKSSEALALQENVVEVRRRVLGDAHPDTRESVKLLGADSQRVARAVQIYVSYARNDDASPPGSREAKGVVALLCDALEFDFRRYEEPHPLLWRDKRGIGLGDTLETVTANAIAKSDIFLIVLSRNWLASRYCRQELELWIRNWRSTGIPSETIEQRIVVAPLHRIPAEQLPAVLQGRQGFEFFSVDPQSRDGNEQRFFAGGEIRDARYFFQRIRELASFLGQTARRLASGSDGISATVYLAKPASDMREAYVTLAGELRGRGYNVVPAVDTDIPSDPSAESFIDALLAKATFSIHLLGDRPGFAPEGSEPIVRLQLARAAVRAAQARNSFRRIIWAPVVWTDDVSSVSSSRDPLAVLAKFGSPLQEDRVDGDDLSTFVNSLAGHFENRANAGFGQAVASDKAAVAAPTIPLAR